MKPGLLFKYSFTRLTVVIAILVSATTAIGQSTSFTYQGRLTDGGTVANGNYDLQFGLFDSLAGGSQAGSTLTLNAVAVSNGVFTVSLDFGANAFPGASRFLEISARPAGSGSFTLLSPRQQITSTPYAVRSLNASSADSVPASGVPAGSGNYIQNSTVPQASSNFNISGNGAAAGTLSGNVVNATTQYNLDGSRILSSPLTNLFAGRSAGAVNTVGGANAFFGFEAGFSNTSGGSNAFFGSEAGFSNTTGIENSFFGLVAGENNSSGSQNSFVGAFVGRNNTTGAHNTFLGFFSGISNTAGDNNTAIGYQADVLPGPIFNPTNATAIGYRAQVTNSNSLVLGSIKGTNGATADTNVGIGTTAPTARLSVIAIGDGARVLQLGTERAWVFKQLGTGPATALELTGDDPINNNKDFIINTAGNVGIGTTAPDQRLSVNGNASKSAGGTSWAVFSDERLKNIKGPFTRGLNTLLRLQPIRYQYKPDNTLGLPGESEEVGFSAQAVEKVLPEAVSRTQQGYLQLQSDPILWTMLNAIKEQQAQIAQQQRQIQGLKKLVCRSRRRAAMCK